MDPYDLTASSIAPASRGLKKKLPEYLMRRNSTVAYTRVKLGRQSDCGDRTTHVTKSGIMVHAAVANHLFSIICLQKSIDILLYDTIWLE